MKFSHLTISLVISQESTSGEENKIRWIIKVNDLYKLLQGDIMFENLLHFEMRHFHPLLVQLHCYLHSEQKSVQLDSTHSQSQIRRRPKMHNAINPFCIFIRFWT